MFLALETKDGGKHKLCRDTPQTFVIDNDPTDYATNAVSDEVVQPPHHCLHGAFRKKKNYWREREKAPLNLLLLKSDIPSTDRNSLPLSSNPLSIP